MRATFAMGPQAFAKRHSGAQFGTDPVARQTGTVDTLSATTDRREVRISAMRYNVWNLLRQSVARHRGWTPIWTSAAPKPRYDIVIVGGGGHGIATAYYLARNH